jgi:hypothetical protein
MEKAWDVDIRKKSLRLIRSSPSSTWRSFVRERKVKAKLSVVVRDRGRTKFELDYHE